LGKLVDCGEAVQEALVSASRHQQDLSTYDCLLYMTYVWSALSLAYSLPGNVLDAVDEHLMEVENAINRDLRAQTNGTPSNSVRFVC